MSEWQTVKLKDVCDRVTVGYVGPMAEQYREEGVTFLRSLNIRPFSLDLSSIPITQAAHRQRITLKS